MRENKSNTILNQYLREKRIYCYYELKVAKGLYFHFSQIEEHQKEAMPALAKEGLVWKLSDEDSRKKPCDGFCTPPLASYIVVRFGMTFYFIPWAEIAKFVAWGNKNMTQEECREHSEHILHLT